MVQCTYCNKEFKIKYTLKTHQSLATCLKNKPEYIEPIIYQCSLCEKEFVNKQNLQIHDAKCPLRHQDIINKFESVNSDNITLKHKVKALMFTVNEQARELDNCKQQIDELKALVNKLSDKPIIVNNNNNIDNRKIQINIRIKNYIKASPECMSVENLQKYIHKLNISHVLSEGEGYGRFVVQYIKDNIRMITTDASRRVVFYKGENGKIVKDIGLINFFEMFCKAYLVRVEDLVKQLQETLNLDLSEPDNIEQYRGYTKHVTQIKQGSKGDKVDFIPSAVKVITSGTDHNNLIC